MDGKCARDITHVPEMCLVETWQVNGSCPFNVPDMFPPVSRGPRPQCLLVTGDQGGVSAAAEFVVTGDCRVGHVSTVSEICT